MSSKNAHNACTQNKINIKHRSILEIEKNDFELIKTDFEKNGIRAVKLKILNYWVGLNTKLSFCTFCIYNHPVNPKFTT